MIHEVGVEIGGKTINFSTGELAKQADGSILCSMGETSVLATAVADKKPSADRDFFPLSVEYKEKYYAAGRMPGGYVKREGRPADHEILVCRITDRPLRPLFPKDFLNEVQIVISTLSSDRKQPSDVLAINAASAALTISGIPFHGPVGGVRVGRIDGQFVANPDVDQIEKSDIDLMVAGTVNAVTMIEGSSKNVTEEDILNAVMFAHDNIKKICAVQSELKAKCGKPLMSYVGAKTNEEIFNAVKSKYLSEIEKLSDVLEKKAREDAFNDIVVKAQSELSETYPDGAKDIYNAVHDIDRDIVRRRIIFDKKRADGRKLDEVRPISVRAGVLPRVHGSSLFTRGQTQSMGIVTLGSEKDVQKVDTMNREEVKRFFLHYNFPPFSVGETGRIGGTGRREIGHGILAERALQWTLPESSKFPYAVRLVSEILESNGSSSMATVCSGSLAFFDAGIPVKAPIAGIAMGLVMEDGKHAVLTDIQGIEDHLGDMDFKVAGTKEGITAFQLDIKIEGITPEIMKEALAQAKEGRLHILGKMNEVISEPNKELSPYAPRFRKVNIPQDKIGGLIGPGGKNIRGIVDSTGADVNVAEDGEVSVYAIDLESLEKAVRMVQLSVAEVESGKIYDGVVKRVMEYGAFVEVLPGKEGLLHISKLDYKRVANVTDVINIGDSVKVKVLNIDKAGRIDLSRKDAMPKPETESE